MVTYWIDLVIRGFQNVKNVNIIYEWTCTHACSTRQLVSRHTTETEETNILNKHNVAKGPNWQEADQLARYKARTRI